MGNYGIIWGNFKSIDYLILDILNNNLNLNYDPHTEKMK